MSHTCHHIDDTGRAFKSFAVTGQRFCFHHLQHRAHRLRAAQARARSQRFAFLLPPLDSFHEVQSALSQLAQAIAFDVIDRHSVHLVLSVLRVASANLRHPDKWQPSLFESAEPAPDLDLDTPPHRAFPPTPDDAAAPPLSPTFGDGVGSHSPHSLPQLPFSGNYCGDHHSRECECCRIRAGYPVTPEHVELVEVSQTSGPDAAAARSKQLLRNSERRRLTRDRKRYSAIALEHNLRRAADLLADRKLAERASPDQPDAPAAHTPSPDQPSAKPPASAPIPSDSASATAQKCQLTPTG